MNLFAITEEIKTLAELIESHCIANDGDVTGVETTISEWSESVSGDLDKKLCDCAWLVKEWSARAEARKLAASDLNEQAKADVAKAEKLKAWMLYCLQSANISNISAGVFQISTAKAGSGSCILDVADSAIPDEWIKIERKTNLAAIKQAIKDGNESAKKIAHIEEPKTTLRIK